MGEHAPELAAACARIRQRQATVLLKPDPPRMPTVFLGAMASCDYRLGVVRGWTMVAVANTGSEI